MQWITGMNVQQNGYLCWRMKTFRTFTVTAKMIMRIRQWKRLTALTFSVLNRRTEYECGLRVALIATTYLHGVLKVNLITDSPIHASHAIHGISWLFCQPNLEVLCRWERHQISISLNEIRFASACVMLCIVCEPNFTDQRHRFN